MDAQQALADLTEISSQIKDAVILDGRGKVAGSTLPDGEAFARGAADLLAAADQLKPGNSPLTQLDVFTAAGSVFIVRQEQATIAATTGPDPTVGLVFYDLKSALRSVEAAPKPKSKAPARKRSGAAAPKKSSPAKKASAKKPAAPRKKPDAS